MTKTASSSPPEDSATQILANLLKATSDPLRLEILRVLAKGSYGVLELTRIFDAKQSGMSHHLKVLASVGLVSTRREGNSIYYRRTHLTPVTSHARLITQLFQEVDAITVRREVQAQVANIQRERAQASQIFFAENADKFAEQQDLIASYPVYAPQIIEMLDAVSGDLCSNPVALEIGPGAGEFLPELAKRFNTVVAVDNTKKMLDKAKALVEKKSLQNVSCFFGDTQTALQKNIKADCIVMNMVLHHTPSPADIFADVSELLNEGGVVLVTDLCRHDQQWAQDACGDLWLGFEPQDLTEWAEDAQLTEGQSSFFALRNGFQIQLRQFLRN